MSLQQVSACKGSSSWSIFNTFWQQSQQNGSPDVKFNFCVHCVQKQHARCCFCTRYTPKTTYHAETGSNLDQERTDVCEEGTKCSGYLYIFDHNNTQIVLSLHQQKYFVFLYTIILIKTLLWKSVQMCVYCKWCFTVYFNGVLA